MQIDLGNLSKPATVLIEKISDAIGGIFRPYQIRRIAAAERDAAIIGAQSRIEVSELELRAVQRLFTEEGRKQENIESIVVKALPGLEDNGKPQSVEDDWISNFFDKCRLISDEEMQGLWARVLAGEANKPGRFSKRTVNMLSSLDKYDAELFRSLCSFCWVIDGKRVLLVYDFKDSTYQAVTVNFETLNHLNGIGLVSFDMAGDYFLNELPKKLLCSYFDDYLEIEYRATEANELQVGQVLFTRVGEELAAICGASQRAGFKEYVIDHWTKLGYKVHAPAILAS